jgi:hypothetical protein
MDIRNLEFEDDSFDVAIDKGERLSLVRCRPDSCICQGTMDAMMTTKGDVWVRLPITPAIASCKNFPLPAGSSATSNRRLHKRSRRGSPVGTTTSLCEKPSIITSRNRRRVLRKGSGVFLYLTFGQPHFRKRYLTRPETTLEIQQIGDAFHYYLYILRT